MKKNVKSFILPIAVASTVGLTELAVAETVTITLDFDDFSKVELSVPTNTNIQVGSGYSIKITGEDKIMEKIEVEVKRDTLVIKRENEDWGFFNRGSSNDDIDVEITMPDINGIEVNGSSDVEIEGVDNDELDIEINGSGNIDVTGGSERVEIEINGSGDVDLAEVSGNDVNVEINGSGDVELTSGVCQNLDIEINGSGSVRAKDVVCQNAEVEISGSGDSEVHAIERVEFDSHGSGSVDVYGKPKEVIDHAARRRSNLTIH